MIYYIIPFIFWYLIHNYYIFVIIIIIDIILFQYSHVHFQKVIFLNILLSTIIAYLSDNYYIFINYFVFFTYITKCIEKLLFYKYPKINNVFDFILYLWYFKIKLINDIQFYILCKYEYIWFYIRLSKTKYYYNYFIENMKIFEDALYYNRIDYENINNKTDLIEYCIDENFIKILKYTTITEEELLKNVKIGSYQFILLIDDINKIKLNNYFYGLYDHKCDTMINTIKSLKLLEKKHHYFECKNTFNFIQDNACYFPIKLIIYYNDKYKFKLNANFAMCFPHIFKECIKTNKNYNINHIIKFYNKHCQPEYLHRTNMFNIIKYCENEIDFNYLFNMAKHTGLVDKFKNYIHKPTKVNFKNKYLLRHYYFILSQLKFKEINLIKTVFKYIKNKAYYNV